MRKFATVFIVLLGVFVYSLGLLPQGLVSVPSAKGQTLTQGPTVHVHPQNPKYFADSNGNPLYLTGSHTWALLHQHPDISATDTSDAHMAEFLDTVQGHGNNFVRFWSNSSYLESKPFPWKRTGPGTAADGLPKFDMKSFDNSYFTNLRKKVEMIENRGMYASVMLFGSYNGIKSDWANNSAWYPGNNINPELASAFTNSNPQSFFTTNSAALAIQKSLVKRTIDELNHLDNIMWEIMNEPDMPPSEVWHNEIIAYIRDYEATKPKQHLIVATTGGASGNLNSSLYKTTADVIAPTVREVNYKDGGPVNYDAKLVFVDSDHLYGYSKLAQKPDILDTLWKSVTRGNHFIFMDSYDTVDPVGNDGFVDPAWNVVRDSMGISREYLGKMDLVKVTPSITISSTGYSLVNPGKEYLVYQPSSKAFTVNLTAGDYDYEWFNTSTAKASNTGTITASGGNYNFTSPFGYPALLFIKASTSTPPPPPADPVCGDNQCNGNETCSTCASDCGVCAPPPSIPPAVGKLEAEDAAFGDTSAGTTKISQVHTGYSGSGYIDMSDFPNGKDSFIEWTMDVATAGKYKLDFSYALNGTTRSVDLFINGQNVGTINFTSTGSWTSRVEIGNEYDLPKGIVKVRIQATGLYGGPDVDYMRVTEVSVLPPAPPICGDNECNNGAETCDTCSADCGTCQDPTPPPSNTGKLEAEDASYGDNYKLGTTKVATEHSGYSGSGFVDISDYPNGKGGYVEWEFNVENAGTYSLDIAYALYGGKRYMNLIVNGSSLGELPFAKTGAWDKWSMATKAVVLKNGTNTVRLEGTRSNGGPNIDYLNTQLLVSSSTKYEAENAVFGDIVGGGKTKVAKDFNGYSGTGFIDYSDLPAGTGSFVEWSVDTGDAGEYLLKFAYALDSKSTWIAPSGGRPLDLTVNGKLIENITFFGTGNSWEAWDSLSTMVPLNEGTNKIRLQATHMSGGPNMDYLEVTPVNGLQPTGGAASANSSEVTLSPFSNSSLNAVNNTVDSQGDEVPQSIEPVTSSESEYVTPTESNMVFSTSFEKDPMGDFSTSGRQAEFSWASDTAHTGGHSLKTVVKDSRYYGSWTSKRTYVQAEANQTYDLSLWLKGVNVTDGMTVTMSYYGGLSGTQYLGRFETTVPSSKVTPSWSQTAVQGAAPENTTYIRVSISLKGSGTLWVDDLEVQKVLP
ncbi:MAG: carbohydrate-binding protein [Patescibacteria group bacterium]